MQEMQDVLIAHVKELHATYCKLYEELSETESTPKKEWQASLDTEAFDSSAEDCEMLQPLRERAIETDDPAELLAILETIADFTSELKQWLNSMYFAATKRDVPAGSAEDLETILKQIQDTLKSAHQLKAGGMPIDPEAVLAATGSTKTRKVKGGASKTVYAPPGRIRVKTRGQRRVGKEAKTTQLVVDGKPVTDTTLGDALRGVGLTWEAFQSMLAEKFPDVKLPWNKEALYESHMFDYNGHKLGLRMIK